MAILSNDSICSVSALTGDDPSRAFCGRRCGPKPLGSFAELSNHCLESSHKLFYELY